MSRTATRTKAHETTMRLLSLLVAGAAAAPFVACGGRVSDEQGAGATDGDGASATPKPPRGSASGSASGTAQPTDCGMILTEKHEIDRGLCELQPASTSRYGATRPGCEGRVCSWTGTLPCLGLPDGGADADAPDAPDASTPTASECVDLCGAIAPAGAPTTNVGRCSFLPQPDGSRLLSCGGCGAGRPPRGFVAIEPAVAPSPEAAYLARAAQLEAASVESFLALHDDLARLDAPSDLLRAVRIAAADEVRHAATLRAEAERRGAVVPATHLTLPRGRSACALALENAEEGCALETFGAVLARMQAEHATDERMRAIMTTIAAEELGHAALSWRVAAWLDTQLVDDERARVDHARRAALATLDAELAGDDHHALPALGVPRAADARAALAALRAPLDLGAPALFA